MNRIDCMAAGLAPQPSTNPALASGPRSGLATLGALSFGLIALPMVAPAQAQPALAGSAAPMELPVTPAPAAQVAPGPVRIRTGLVTIESDQQRADQLTGVITATGNVRIVYPDERVVATSRQAQYFSREGRVVLSGDVDIVQEGGNLIRAEHVIYLVESERVIAIPPQGQQVFSQVRMPEQQKAGQPGPGQLAPAQPVAP